MTEQHGVNFLASLMKQTTPSNSGTRLLFGNQHPKRKAFFSFHYDDIMRVNNVRNAWRIRHPENALMRSFQDSSLWENKKSEGDDAVKKLIREGVEYTSAVCVLIGTETWARRWVKYEIARSVIDKRGLLAVHINSIKHNESQTSDAYGINPLDLIGIYKDQSGQYYLCEKKFYEIVDGQPNWQWEPYQDYSQSVSRPNYLPALTNVGTAIPLSKYTSTYCFTSHQGHKNIGAWIDSAAQAAGR